MEVHRGISGTLERESSHVPKKNILQRFAESTRIRLLGTMLALGGGLAMLQSNIPDRVIAKQQVQEPKDSSSQTALRDTLRHHPDVSEVSFEKGRFRCTFDGIVYIGTLNESDHLTSLTGNNSDIQFETPIEGSLTGSVLGNAHRMLKHIPSPAADHVRKFSSSDGVRFFYHEKDGDAMHEYIAVPDQLLKVIEKPKDSAHAEWKNAAKILADHQTDIGARLKGAIKDSEQSEWRLREQNEWLQKRLIAISNYLSSGCDAYREHPYKRVEWERTQTAFHAEADPLWKACQDNPHTIGFSTYQDRLDKLQKALETYEQPYFIDPGTSHIEGADALNVLERIERSSNVTERYNSIWSALNDKIASAQTRQEQRQWEEKKSTLRQGWMKSIDQYAKKTCWQSWDPSPEPLARHRAYIQHVEDFLKPYEEALDINPLSTNNDIIARFDKERTLLQSRMERETSAKHDAVRWVCKTVSQHSEVVIIQDVLHPRAWEMHYHEDGGVVHEKYAQAKREYREWISDDGASSSRLYPNNYGQIYESRWARQGGTWHLVTQTRFRADGTKEWVSDAAKDHLEYFASDGQHLARMEYEDGGKRITKVSFFGKNNKEFSTFDREQATHAKLTRDQYIDLLAKELDTGEKLNAFLDIFMQYTSDNPDYWQTAGETVQRVVGTRMRGDCDDYAFLAREILRRQGKNAYVVYIPGHATCIWVKKRDDGRFDAYSIGTFGFDKNGNCYGGPQSQERERGFTNLIDALNALMIKFRYPGLGLEDGQHHTLDPDNIDFMEIYSNGSRGYYKGTANTFVR